MLNISTTLENECLQTFLGKFLRRPTAANTRSNNNRVKSILLLRLYGNGGHKVFDELFP